jgi:hypothetical protein
MGVSASVIRTLGVNGLVIVLLSGKQPDKNTMPTAPDHQLYTFFEIISLCWVSTNDSRTPLVLSVRTRPIIKSC